MTSLLRTSLALGAFGLFALPAAAQSADSAIPAVPLLSTHSPASPSFAADCASDTEVLQASATSAFGVSADGQEFGQSFTAPCDGVLTDLTVIYQAETVGDPLAISFFLYEGEGTASAFVRQVDTTFTAEAAALLTFEFDPYPVVQGQVYTVFVDLTFGNAFIQVNDSEPYAGGSLYVSNTGSAAGATPAPPFDLVFRSTFQPPFNSEQQFSFEDEPGTTYTLTNTLDSGFDFFGRFGAPDNTNGARDDFQTGFDGDFAIFGQDIDGSGGVSPGVITIPDLDIADQSGVSVTVSLGALNSEFADSNDFNNYEAADGDGIEIYATVDGGARRLIGKFSPPAVGAGTCNGSATCNTVGAGDLYRDSDFDGVGEGTRLTTTLSDFQFNLGAEGDLLTLEIELTSTGSFETIVVDNVRLVGTVPVELTAFDAVADGNDVLLAWTTASETNNAGFDVEMRSAGTDWRQIAFVNGHGTTAEARSYTFRAEGLAAGTHRFRLRQVDLDGTATHTPEVEVAIGVAGAVEVSAVGPNPMRGAAALTVAVATAQRVTVSVYDVLGRLVATPFAGALEAGTEQAVALDASALAPGTYVVRVAGETFAETQRVTVAR